MVERENGMRCHILIYSFHCEIIIKPEKVATDANVLALEKENENVIKRCFSAYSIDKRCGKQS